MTREGNAAIVRASQLLHPPLAEMHAQHPQRAEFLVFTVARSDKHVGWAVRELSGQQPAAWGVEFDELLRQEHGERAVRHAIVGTWIDIIGRPPKWLSSLLE